MLSNAGGECKPCVQILWSMSLVGTSLFLLGILIACCCCCCCLANVAVVESDEKKKSEKILAGEVLPPLTKSQKAIKFANDTFIDFLRLLGIQNALFYDDKKTARRPDG